jgi:hypothetical protein
LLHQVITSPNQGAASLAQACATVCLSFAWLEGAADRLGTRHRNQRERVLLHALTQALGILEIHDLAATLRIADEVVQAVAPLSGEPLNLAVGTPCVFGAVCVHQGGV